MCYIHHHRRLQCRSSLECWLDIIFSSCFCPQFLVHFYSWWIYNVHRRSERWDDPSTLDQHEEEKWKEGRSISSEDCRRTRSCCTRWDVDPNPLLWINFCGSNQLIRRGLVGLTEILKINLVHVLKFCHTMQFLFIIVLGNINGLNKFCHCRKSCRGRQYLCFDTKITPIAHVVREI